jgi:hypothetical protein
MVAYFKQHPECRVLLVEKTDRLYRNFKDYVTIDELKLEIHIVKENVILSNQSRSSEKFVHGIKVLMAKNYIDNLSEETKKHPAAARGRDPVPAGGPATVAEALRHLAENGLAAAQVAPPADLPSDARHDVSRPSTRRSRWMS